MKITSTLFRYLIQRLMVHFLVIYGGLLGILYVFEAVELLRRLAKRGGVEFDVLFLMTAYKIPEVGMQILPFGLFFACVFMLWSMTKSSELAIIRASGVSAWKFMYPLLLGALLLGVLKVTVFNPVSSVLLRQYESMETKYLSERNSLIDLSETGLWLKQPEGEQTVIIHAPQVKLPEWVFKNILILNFNQDYKLLSRVDAKRGQLVDNELVLDDMMIHKPGQAESQRIDELKLKTELNTEDIERQFSTPRTVSFWAMPGYINLLRNAGFPVNPLRALYYKLLADPLLYIALVLLAAAISMRPTRQGRTVHVIAASITVPVLVFFLGDLLQALGISEKLPLFLAASAPAIISFMIGVWGILHLEDG